jgi:AraC-like DNA-binding protein
MPPHSGKREPADRVRYFRPVALPGVELLHASFVTHRYAPHLHPSWTIALVDHGAATFQLDGVRHTAPEGTVFLVPPHAVHTGEPATPEGYRYRVLYLDLMARPHPGAELLASRPTWEVPVVLRHAKLAASLSRLHRSIGLTGRALEQGETLTWVTRELTRLAAQVPVPPSPRRSSQLAVARAISYIHENWRADFDLDHLAREARVSPSHLVRIFNQRVGMPPSAYRRNLRVLAAQRLFRLGWPLVEVALECGFYDQSHLNRHFKSATGVTPRQFALAGC